jgi:glutathione synthase/RimK-type ligase-like ATP-grasp enzyme
MTAGRDDQGSRPVLAIAHGDGSVSAMKLAESARSLCDLIWVVDSSKLIEPKTVRLLRKLGTTVDTVGMSEDEAADALRSCRPDGIVAYADHFIPVASALATRLGLDFHDATVTARLVDKWEQRQALQEAGLPVPRFVPVPTDLTPDGVEAVVSAMRYPAVFKPRRGAFSRNTFPVPDAARLRELLAEHQASAADSDQPMIVEEFLTGRSQSHHRSFADYVSVESLVTDGQVSHVAVTGRFPLAEPFRETGFFIPSALPPTIRTEVLDIASMAIKALGVRIGFLHTEIKLTPDGPRIIEVNGRLGGSVSEMVKMATGLDLLSWTQRVALGEQMILDDLVPTDRIGYLLTPQPPQWARRVVAVEGLDRLSEYPGVQTVGLNRQPGDGIDWRQGSFEFVFSVYGAAADHEGVLGVQRFIDEHVKVTYA